ncbi:MAG TPA: Asp-tRNA(Asn)/Glu-tRNA(Gln) amidotransferase subunit GatB [Candidatus Limnocylindria bacterium]|nr:Asp-tRNA(Asn)/Glu-tRNA(Gln) amidotransferase subunit GatB [Candidatus Limnocylindria bacterium]
MTTPYELVIGIETHVELGTASKMFCACSAKWFGAPANSLVCPVCLGLPGALPVPNRRAIELAITAGLALNCEVPEHTKFDRKNYMYPDLPKGYQISQYDLPFNVNGWLEIPSGDGTKRVRIHRAHLEEDTANTKHGEGYALIDFNRSGVPLLEIVSEPDMSSVDEAVAYVTALREVIVGAGVSEMRLEEGAGRFDVNVSIRFTEGGETRWPPQSEIKNLNSYQAIREAIPYEADRLWREWRDGGEIRTRKGKITVGWSPERKQTFLQRSKEDVQDYRYFPEPDLVRFEIPRDLVTRLRAAIPEMPPQRRARFVSAYGLSEYDARVLVSDRALADFFEEAVKAAGGDAKAVANWMTGEVLRYVKTDGGSIASTKLRPRHIGSLVRLVKSGELSTTAAKDVFAEVWRSGEEPAAVVKTKGLAQVSDEAAIAAAVDAVLAENPKAVADYKAGNERALGALVGAVMKRMGGKANPAVINKVLVERVAR